eukprot:4272096-Alexandrium_andersonii.AAC.1
MAAPTVGFTAAPGQHVLRILAHDGPAKDAIGALDALRSKWAGRRTALRTVRTKVAAGRTPGQAGEGVNALWDVAVRITGMQAEALRDEVRGTLQQVGRSEGAYFAWADDDDWDGTTIAPRMKGDICRFVAAIAGYAQTYRVRAIRCRGGIRFTEGEVGEISD